MFFPILCLLLLIALAVYAYAQKPEFGRIASAEEMQAFKKSQNFIGNQFQNLVLTPSLAKNYSFFGAMYRFFFDKSPRHKPDFALPSQKTDLKNLNPNGNVLVWFGHSSYFLQVDGKKILVDPVFSGSASPIAATTKSFLGSDVYSPNDIPDIDLLVITHDHWDHLDFKTVLKLKPKTRQAVTSLGTGLHLQKWGYDANLVSELDWSEHLYFANGFKITAVPARHFSGRGLKRNRSLWAAFVLETPSLKLFLGGDSGYADHFRRIGDKFGPFDLAILECGQYDKAWPYIHMQPGEWLKAATDLKTNAVLPVHWGKFALGLHAWDEPIEKISAEFSQSQIRLWTPMIGEKVDFGNLVPFSKWWKPADLVERYCESAE